MIITTTRHGRSARDTRNLTRHLAKQDGQLSRVVSIGNVPFSNSDDALTYMNMMRDGSRADVAFHHLTLSPSQRITDDQRDEAVQRILSGLGAEDHPYVVWEHSEKVRHGTDVDQHFHIVLGHIGPDGKALDDSHSFAKLEAVARSLEVDFEHALTPSRRTQSVKSRLIEMGREDVAQHLQISAELPRASMTAGQRAMAARKGFDLPALQQEIREAWSNSDGLSVFKSVLEAGGFSVTSGKRKGVWIVRHGEIEIGALDRIVKQKRALVAQRMEGINNEKPEKNISRRSNISRSSIKPKRSPESSTFVETPGASGTVEWWSDRAVATELRSNIAGPETSIDDVRGSTKRSSRFEESQTIIALDQMQLASSTILATQDLMTHKMPVNLHQLQDAFYQIEQYKTGWEWVQEFRNDLLKKIREIRDRILGPSKNDIMDFSIIEKQDTHNDAHDDGEKVQLMRFG